MKPGSFLGYRSEIPDLALVAKYLSIRLHPEVNGHPELGNFMTLYPTHKPNDSVIESAVTDLKNIINNPSGALWTDEVQSISANLVGRLPAEAIDAKDLVQLLMRKHILPDIASWAIFEAIQSNTLRAIYQFPDFEPHPTRTRRETIAYYASKKSLGNAQGDPEAVDVSKSEVRRVTQRLLVWSSTRKPKGRQGAPAKFECTAELETRIRDMCRQYDRVPYGELARRLGSSYTPQFVKAINARVKKREERKSSKNDDRDKPLSR